MEVLDDSTIQLEGRLIGGCMDILQMYPGTPYDKVKEFNAKYQEDGFIWFMESCDLNLMGIRRAIWQLKQAGWFEHLKGFLIGRPLCYGEEAFGIDQYQAVTGVLAEYNVPIIMDVDMGHLPPMMPVICGSTAEVVVNGNHISIQYTMK
jgi:muramoyltetrapeptide carboxypeptidase LdcA involved in peptidoglycan recycling